jgi:WD40 repeat protein
VIHWHAPSGKALHKIVETDNSVLAMDFNYDGAVFATGGKDFQVIVDSMIFGSADWY